MACGGLAPTLSEMESTHLENYIFKELGERKEREQGRMSVEGQGEKKDVF